MIPHCVFNPCAKFEMDMTYRSRVTATTTACTTVYKLWFMYSRGSVRLILEPQRTAAWTE